MGRRRGRNPAAVFLILLLLGACVTQSAPGEPCEHVVIVSIDGLRPGFYGDAELAPTLTSMASGGARAKAVESVYPSSTYPAHASIVTGVRPAKHGIYANTTWTEHGSTRNWYWTEKDLRVRTLWQAAREKGLKVAITYWPTSVGAQADWVLGEIWDPDGKDTVRRLAAAATPGLLAELALGVGIPQEKIAEDRAAIDGFVSRAAAYVFRKYHPHLQFVHLLNVDEVQHKDGPDAPAVRDAVRVQDQNIARIRKAIAESGLGPRTAFLVVGDHGFTSITRNVSPNDLFLKAGLLAADSGKVTSWRALTRSSGGSASIYVKDAKDLSRVREVLLAGSSIDGQPGYRVLERPELDLLGYNPEAAFAVEPGEGVAITERLGPSAPTVKGNHGQLPTRPGLETGFVAEGAGIQPGALIERMKLVDIAPAVAELLGLDLPGAEGRCPPGLLR
ncbi:MAG TPA: ectonucleotide pyrophosphatase/phosphodiesterase [Planctomycetota bacterium]|nr:ectonucleotide pyrophosphatase/phosphodiesterase [Planctomycetota bacterium]